LQAELIALQLALEIAFFLNFAGTNFLTDSATIADEVKTRNFSEQPGHWSLRPLWSQITTTIPNHLLKVFWISREINIIADKLAKEAKADALIKPIYNCQNISHIAYPSRDCHASSLNAHFSSLNCKINHVLCS
jgi:ribonuclease HI